MKFDLQKASMLRRVPAWLLDVVLLVTIAAGVLAGMSIILDVDTHIGNLDAIYREYEQTYGIDFTLTEEAYQSMSKEEMAVYEQAAEALSKDVEAQRAYEMVLNVILITVTVSFLVSYFILEFLIPLWLKNGQTIGKKVFSVGVMRTDGVKITPFMLFVRSILGKYTLETMVPAYLAIMLLFGSGGLIALVLLGLILLLQIIFMIATHTNSAIHDLLACTVTVDLASQMIFDSPEDLLEYQKRVQAEIADQADY